MLFGITKIFECLRYAINAHTTSNERRKVNFAFGDCRECIAKLGGRVAKNKLQRQFFADTQHGVHVIFLHTCANDQNA